MEANTWAPLYPDLGGRYDKYSKRSGLILGFHGTDESIVRDVIMNAQSLKPSINAWDWIGHGIYFWEHSPSRAMEFAQTASRRIGSSIKSPAVLGAVLDLGHCLDLLDYGNLELMKNSYDSVKHHPLFAALDNRPAPNSHADDLLLRDLDCAVVEAVHEARSVSHQQPFDSVKAVFWEGPLLYPNAGFREKNHIQICVRNPDCIKAFFLPQTTSAAKALR